MNTARIRFQQISLMLSPFVRSSSPSRRSQVLAQWSHGVYSQILSVVLQLSSGKLKQGQIQRLAIITRVHPGNMVQCMVCVKIARWVHTRIALSMWFVHHALPVNIRSWEALLALYVMRASFQKMKVRVVPA